MTALGGDALWDGTGELKAALIAKVPVVEVATTVGATESEAMGWGDKCCNDGEIDSEDVSGS